MNIPNRTLREFALQLGSDCPFFLLKRICYASGRGNLLENISLDLTGYYVVIVKPEVSVSTAWAYSKVRGKCKNLNPAVAVMHNIEHWKDELVNDFEKIVFSKHPEMARIKEELNNEGAVYAAMSGSGSAFYGIFKSPPKEIAKKFPATYVWDGPL